MEINFIEKYVIGKLESLEKENAELKEKLKAAQAQDNASEPSGAPALGMFYHVESSSWRIAEENLANYERALSEKDFGWLTDHSYRITPRFWNYEIKVGDDKILLRISPSYTDLKADAQIVEWREGESFETLSAAQDKLLKMLSQDIEEYKKKQAAKKNA
jgi:hypothetical protein